MKIRDHHAAQGNGELQGRASDGPIPDSDAPRRLLTGLDDGPPLPSQAIRNRAAERIEARQPRTDAERINWLESVKYAQFGIGYDGHRYQVEIRVWPKRYFGRTMREAIDAGIKGATA